MTKKEEKLVEEEMPEEETEEDEIDSEPEEEEEIESFVPELDLPSWKSPRKTSVEELIIEKTNEIPIENLEEDLSSVSPIKSDSKLYSSSNPHYSSSSSESYSSSNNPYDSNNESNLDYESRPTQLQNLDINTGRELRQENPFNSSGLIPNFQNQKFSETYQGKMAFDDVKDLGKTKKKEFKF